MAELRGGGRDASAAYRRSATSSPTTYFERGPQDLKAAFAADRFAMGEQEYDWAVKNNFHLDTTAAQLFDEAWPIVQETQTEMIDLARQIGAAHRMAAAGGRPRRGARGVRSAVEGLSEVGHRDDRVVPRRRVPGGRLRAQDRPLRRARPTTSSRSSKRRRRCARRSTAPRITRRRHSRTPASAATT